MIAMSKPADPSLIARLVLADALARRAGFIPFDAIDAIDANVRAFARIDAGDHRRAVPCVGCGACTGRATCPYCGRAHPMLLDIAQSAADGQ